MATSGRVASSGRRTGYIPAVSLWTGERRLELALTALFCVVAFLGAAWVSDRVFERLPHTEDESAFLFQAQTIASGELIASAPDFPLSFDIPFVIVREDMWFGKYPPGYPLVLAFGVLLGAPWIVNALAAAACVAATYAFARWLYDATTAVVAAGLLAVSPFLLLQAGSLLSHVVSLFWTLLFLALFPFARQRQCMPFAGLSGVAIGMLFLTRPLTAVGIALPYILWVLLSSLRDRRIMRTDVAVAASAIPFVAAFLAYNDVTTGSPLSTAYELWWEFDRIGFGEDIGINGHDFGDGLRNTQRNLNELAHYLFGWPGRSSLLPAILATVISAVTLIRRLRRRPAPRRARGPLPEEWDLILAGVVVSLMAVHILYWTPGQMYGPRYFMEAIGPLAILTARFFTRFCGSLHRWLQTPSLQVHHAATWSFGLMALIIIVLTTYAYTRWAPDAFDRYHAWNNVNREDLAIVERANLEQALVFVERTTWTDYAPFFAQHGPNLEAPIVYAIDRGAVENQQVMMNYPDREIYRYMGGRLIRIQQ